MATFSGLLYLYCMFILKWTMDDENVTILRFAHKCEILQNLRDAYKRKSSRYWLHLLYYTYCLFILKGTIVEYVTILMVAQMWDPIELSRRMYTEILMTLATFAVLLYLLYVHFKVINGCRKRDNLEVYTNVRSYRTFEMYVYGNPHDIGYICCIIPTVCSY